MGDLTFRAPYLVEGTLTVDGRVIERGALKLPDDGLMHLPVYDVTEVDGTLHPRVGCITRLWRADETATSWPRYAQVNTHVWAFGHWLTPSFPEPGTRYLAAYLDRLVVDGSQLSGRMTVRSAIPLAAHVVRVPAWSGRIRYDSIKTADAPSPDSSDPPSDA